MKILGALLLMSGGMWVRRDLMAAWRNVIRTGEELLGALQILERGVYAMRQPLPQLAEDCRRAGRVTAPFWMAVSRALAAGDFFQGAWRGALPLLPSVYRPLMEPLWQTLPTGEGLELLHQVREDVYRAVGQARQDSRERNKLVTALCLSVSLLTVVVLL